MARAGTIEDRDTRRVVIELREYLTGLKAGELSYSRRKMRRFRDRINSSFARYIKRRRKEIGDIAEDYDVTKKEIRRGFAHEERNIISTFARNVDRAFGQAMHSIERAIGESLTAPGRFGMHGLLSLLRQRQKMPKEFKDRTIEGFTRLTKDRKIFTINLIDYLILLLRTSQIEWDRRVSAVTAFRVKVDLVRISPQPCWLGPKADEVCNRWRDRIVSLTGFTPDFPKLQDALDERPPLFHPNCSHTMIPLTPEEEAMARQRKIKFYETLKKYL